MPLIACHFADALIQMPPLRYFAITPLTASDIDASIIEPRHYTDSRALRHITPFSR